MVRINELILKKRRGYALSKEEIHYLIDGATRGAIPDYQLAAWLMAVFFRGMTKSEQAEMTMAMVHSGDTVDLSGIKGIKVDKHSTGGVGDTTTLVLVPLVAAVGCRIAKMSGRGLGHTGGTIDKLESIPGFATEMGLTSFVETVNRVGAAIVAQTGNLVPADKKLYALRDVTATVDSIPLIATSIMSKKIAAGADAIVLDVKVGSGAFMKDNEQAFQLATTMVEIGREVGRRTVAVVTRMDQPLGRAIGNALEVREALLTLHGHGERDLLDLCLRLGSHMVYLAGVAHNVEEGRSLLESALVSGRALDKFRELVSAQGGNPAVIDQPELLPTAHHIIEVPAAERGYIQDIDAEELGQVAMILGAGRESINSTIDPGAGVILRKRPGDWAEKGDALVELHTNRDSVIQEALERIAQSVRVGAARPDIRPLVVGEVTEKDIA